MKQLMKQVSLLGLLFAPHLAPGSTGSATREYAFSGPSLTGRFVVEDYTSPTPIGPLGEDELVREYAGEPYLFSAKLGEVSYSTTHFTLGVKNNIVAFGRSDVYGLTAANMGLLLMGPSQGNPYTSTMPHDMEAYSGLHYITLQHPETGEWLEFQIDSLVALPVLSIAKSSTGLTLRWPASSARFVLESTDSLSSAAAWSEVTDVAEPVGGSYSVTVAPEMPRRFFRLRMSQ
jgi:hypothetical protein